jgi:hypothetical protein
MTNNYPITPPPELVEQWVQATESNDCIGAFPTNFEKRICTAAARWGADQELEACCVWLRGNDPYEHDYHQMLRTARRPKPPSLKAQALTALSEADQGLNESEWQQRSDIIRRALEQLDD